MKREAPAAMRNREAIAAILADELPKEGTALEVASGTGEHVVYFARLFPALDWQPSDPDAEARASVSAWRAEAKLANLRPPIDLDAASPTWPRIVSSAIVCINMIHISPPAACEGLFAGSACLLSPGDPLILYGPYFEEETPASLSNLQFDQSLRSRNPEWGIRQLAWVDSVALQFGFARTRRAAMPANNLSLVYRRQ